MKFQQLLSTLLTPLFWGSGPLNDLLFISVPGFIQLKMCVQILDDKSLKANSLLAHCTDLNQIRHLWAIIHYIASDCAVNYSIHLIDLFKWSDLSVAFVCCGLTWTANSFDFLTLHLQMMILSLLRLFWLMSLLVWTSVMWTSAQFHLESCKKPQIFVHCLSELVTLAISLRFILVIQ